MTVNVKVLSPGKLKELKAGEKIMIRYARSQYELDQQASRIIYEQFPKKIATAFSTTWAKLFPSVNMMTLAQLGKPKRNSVTVVGGEIENVLTVLSWMLSCCSGSGMQKFPIYTINPFSSYFIIGEIADQIGIDVLSQEMTHRLNGIIANRQIHSDDVKIMYLHLPAGNPILKDIAVNIATLMWQRKLRAFPLYINLRKDIPTFNQDVNEAWEVIGVRQDVEHKQTVKERQRGSNPRYQGRKASTSDKGLPHHRRLTYRPRGSTTHRAMFPSHPESTNIAEPPTKHKILQCPIARKASGGRPAYHTLPLAEVGINNYSFTGQAGLARASPPREKAESPAANGTVEMVGSNLNDAPTKQADDKGLTKPNAPVVRPKSCPPLTTPTVEPVNKEDKTKVQSVVPTSTGPTKMEMELKTSSKIERKDLIVSLPQ